MLKTKMIERKKLMIQKRNGKYPHKKWKISINIIFLLILILKRNGKYPQLSWIVILFSDLDLHLYFVVFIL